MVFIETEVALGARIQFFPEGAAVQAGGTCSEAAIPDANDPGYILLNRVKSWEPARKDVKYQVVKDSETGHLRLANEIETDGYMEYKYTVSIVRALLFGIFFRSAAPLSAVQQTFAPEQGVSPRGWLIMVNKDQDARIVLAANLWGRLKCDSGLKGGGGDIVEPELLFTQYENNIATMFLGDPANA